MKLYFVSDVHLELRKPKFVMKPMIDPQIDTDSKNILALCGDIGNPFSEVYEQFVGLHAKLFHHIFIVSGNHEYYSHKKHMSISETDSRIRDIQNKFTNVTFLQKNSFEIDNFVFLGCTLWSNVDQCAETCMSDYLKIYTYDMFNDKRLINYMDILQLHGDMLEWLEETIAQTSKDKKVIVLTHHAPSFEMTDNDNYKNYYATDCEYLCDNQVIVWLSGHTHKSKDIKIKNTICASNCLGYPNEKGTFYIQNKHISLNEL